ncbi:Carbohydrate acetyl esterase/feruloyl esterase precursor [Anatilimnocola aggregata]|uniref:Carbohydrate acetyl esterase/feruloyl esterase n=1 Tax=Anatilimnocola aggregata TaxID=2528021 RepID=A0A517YGJ8_9BACT|nr:sialate O-acetylesterase [Anatilimnocola aggregata]QDU29338.1 Carbohydrate acetyl esterase/feruloyl esterase precursor [Anatilimnocola aggregata]
MITRCKFLSLSLFGLALSLAPISWAADEVKLPAKDKFHLFLLVGQSNMAGRGKVEAEDQKPHERVLMLNKEGAWVPAADPLHFDKSSAGVGLGKTFGKVIADANPEITVGLIPCAVGGSPIDSWKPGVFYKATNSHPWDDAIRRAKLAQEKGVLKGMLWHQGESDSSAKSAPAYGDKLQKLVGAFRQELQADVPFLVGQLGQYDDVPWDDNRKIVDQAHRDLAKQVKQAAFVPSDGLKHKGDKVHFDSAGLREFGKRYADAYLKLAKANP